MYFQGESIGKPKRTFTVLSEGQCFGEYSFITGRVPYMSVSSSGLTQILKLKRSDFLDLITTYKADNVQSIIYNRNYSVRYRITQYIIVITTCLNAITVILKDI